MPPPCSPPCPTSLPCGSLPSRATRPELPRPSRLPFTHLLPPVETPQISPPIQNLPPPRTISHRLKGMPAIPSPTSLVHGNHPHLSSPLSFSIQFDLCHFFTAWKLPRPVPFLCLSHLYKLAIAFSESFCTRATLFSPLSPFLPLGIVLSADSS